jgi:hypothetical protein
LAVGIGFRLPHVELAGHSQNNSDWLQPIPAIASQISISALRS